MTGYLSGPVWSVADDGVGGLAKNLMKMNRKESMEENQGPTNKKEGGYITLTANPQNEKLQLYCDSERREPQFFDLGDGIKKHPEWVKAEEDVKRLRKYKRNVKKAMKNLQDAHVRTLYRLQKLETEKDNWKNIATALQEALHLSVQCIEEVSDGET